MSSNWTRISNDQREKKENKFSIANEWMFPGDVHVYSVPVLIVLQFHEKEKKNQFQHSKKKIHIFTTYIFKYMITSPFSIIFFFFSLFSPQHFFYFDFFFSHFVYIKIRKKAQNNCVSKFFVLFLSILL